MIFSFLSEAFGITLSSSLNAAFSSLAKKERVVIINPWRMLGWRSSKDLLFFISLAYKGGYICNTPRRKCIAAVGNRQMQPACLSSVYSTATPKFIISTLTTTFRKTAISPTPATWICGDRHRIFLSTQSTLKAVTTSCYLCVQSLLQPEFWLPC